MSSLDKASLVQIPSGYKATKLYSVVPDSGAGDLSFARSSSGTRVNEQGLIEEVSVLGSELIVNGDFDTNLTPWSTSSWWVWNALGAYHPRTTTHKPLYQQCAVIGKQYNITFDLNIVSGKAKFALGSSTGLTTQVIANNLTTGSYSYLVTAAAEYIVFNREYGFNAEFYVDNVSVKEYITSNVPRLDYTGGGCGKLLIEPQSTNLVTYSEAFNNNSWFISRATVDVNAVTSPDGGTTADLLIPNSNVSGWSGLSFPNASVSVGVAYSGSVYAKSGGYNWLQIGGSSPRFNATFANVNLVDGSLGNNNIDVDVVDVGGGWYRISITDSAASTTTGSPFFIAVYDSDVSTRLPDSPGDGTSGVYLYGAQVEQGDVSSYIPTSGTTVTRTQDTSVTTGLSSLIGQVGGVLYLNVAAQNNSINGRISIGDGSFDNRVMVSYTSTPNQIRVQIASGGSNVFSQNYTLTNATDFNKIAVKWNLNDFSVWVNSIEVLTGNSGNIPLGMDTLSFNRSGSNSRYFYGEVKELAVFFTALTDTELAALTTI